MGAPRQEAPKFMTRFYGDLRDRIAAAAKRNRRSMNTEIIAACEAHLAAGAALEQSDARPRQTGISGGAARIAALREAVEICKTVRRNTENVDQAIGALEAALAIQDHINRLSEARS